MRVWILLLAFFGASSAAMAGDDLQNDMRVYEADDYAGMAYYRMDFGGTEQAPLRHAVGFRVDNERALHSGRPALVKTEYAAGSTSMLVNGVNLSAVASVTMGNGFSFSSMTVTDIVIASVAGVILLVGTASAMDEYDVPGEDGTGGY